MFSSAECSTYRIIQCQLFLVPLVTKNCRLLQFGLHSNLIIAAVTNSITVDLIYLICSNAHGFTHMTFEIFNIVKFLLFICCGCNFAWIVDCLFFFFVVGCRFVDPILTSFFFDIFFRIKACISFFYFCRTY